MKPKRFQKSNRGYFMQLGRAVVWVKCKKETPFYPKIMKLQNHINRGLDKDERIILKNYKAISFSKGVFKKSKLKRLKLK